MADAKPVLEPTTASPFSVPAIVTFWLLAVWSCMVYGLYSLIAWRVELTAIQVGLLSGVIGTETTLLVGSVSFWVGSTAGAKALGDRLAESNRAGQDALAGIAATGTGGGEPRKVEVVNPPTNPVQTDQVAEKSFMERDVP